MERNGKCNVYRLLGGARCRGQKTPILLVTIFLVATLAFPYASVSVLAHGNQEEVSGQIVMVYKGTVELAETSRWDSQNGPVDESVYGLGDEGKSISAYLKRMDIEVLESYESFTLARATESQRALLEMNGFRIRDYGGRTVTGRGGVFLDTSMDETHMQGIQGEVKQHGDEQGYYIMQFIGPVKHEWIQEVQLLNVELLDYLPSFAYIIRTRGSVAGQLPGLPYVQWVGPYHSDYKVSPDISDSRDAIAVKVLLFPGVDPSPVLQRVWQLGGVVLSDFKDSVGAMTVAQLDRSALLTLADMSEVSWIEPRGELSILNNRVRGIVQNGAPGSTPLYDRGFSGKDQLITVCDSGLSGPGTSPGHFDHEAFKDPYHPFYYEQENPDHRKVHLYYRVEEDGVPLGDYDDSDLDLNGHGTHVSGTLAGDAPVTSGGDDWHTPNKYDGVAYDSRIVVCDSFMDSEAFPSDYDNLFLRGYEAGSRIFTNSWGFYHEMDEGVEAGTYTHRSQMVDEFAWYRKDALFVFGVGNEGWSWDPPESKTMTVRQEPTAKNVISVGGSQRNQPELVYFQSSRGPTEDGRLKPTLMSPGRWIHSAEYLTEDEYFDKSGTSMSTPGVSGAAALVREYFAEGWYPSGRKVPENGFDDPSAALVRAVLINGAWEMQGENAHDNPYKGMDYPNVDQGWGRVRLWDSLYFADTSPGASISSRLFVVDEKEGLETGEYVDYYIKVGGSSALKVTLVWTDFPGTPGAAKALVNDIDLELTDPDGVQYKGNVFCTPSCSPTHSVPGGTPDEQNPEERIVVVPATLGTYRIRVTATNVDPVHGRQPFALAVSGIIGEETWLSATGSTQPSLVTDAQGDAHVVWIDQDSEIDDVDVVYAKFSKDGYILTPKTSISEPDDLDGGDRQYGPAIDIDSSGNLYVFYGDEYCEPDCTNPSTRQYLLIGKVSTDGGNSWTAISTTALLGGYVYSDMRGGADIVDTSSPIDIAVDSSGKIHLVWHALYRPPGGRVAEEVNYARGRLMSGAIVWEIQQWPAWIDYEDPLQAHYHKIRYPHIATGSVDVLHLVYSYDDDPVPFPRPEYCDPCDVTGIHYARSTNNGDWWIGTATFLFETVELAWENSIVADDQGNVFLAWNDKNQESVPDLDLEILFSRSSDDGVTWEPKRVIADGISNQHYPVLSLDTADFLHLVWYNVRPITGMICDVFHRASVDGGMIWNGERRLALHYGNQTQYLSEVVPCGSISAAVDIDGVLQVSWSREGAEGGRDGIYHVAAPYENEVSFTTRYPEEVRMATSSASGGAHLVWYEARGGESFTDLAASDADQLYATTYSCKVYASHNHGGNWRFVGEVDFNGCISLVFDSSNQAFILAETGEVFKSVDLGSTWTFEGRVADRMDFVEVDWYQHWPSQLCAIDSSGQVYVSDDGTSWNPSNNDAPGEDYISMDSDSAMWYVLKRNGEVHFSLNEGLSWSLDRSEQSESYTSVLSIGILDVYVLSEPGDVYHRNLLGQYIHVGDVSSATDHVSIAADSGGSLHVLQRRGPVSMSEDDGSTWSVSGDVGRNGDIFYSRIDETGQRVRVEARVTDDSDDMDGIDQFDPVVGAWYDPSSGTEWIYVLYADEETDPATPDTVKYSVAGKRSIDGGENWDPMGSPGILFNSDQGGIYDRGNMLDLAIEETTGMLHLVYSGHTIDSTYENEYILYSVSGGHGDVWSAPELIVSLPPYDTIPEPHYDQINHLRIVVGAPDYLHLTYSWDPGMGPLPGPPWCYPTAPDCNTYVMAMRSYMWTWDTWPQELATTKDIARQSTLVADGNSGVFASWEDKDDVLGTLDIWYRRSLNEGLSWIFPAEILVGSTEDDVHPVFAVSQNGYLYFAYSSDSNGLFDVYFSVAVSPHDPMVDWTEPRRLTFQEGESALHDLALDLNSHFYATWTNDRGISQLERSRVCASSWL